MTDTRWILVGGAIAVVLLIVLVLLRTLTDGRAEVKLTDAAIAVIPVVLALFATGKLASLTVGAEGVKIEAAKQAILEAADVPVADQVDVIEPREVEAAGKGSLDRIPDYLSRGVEALTFQAGVGGYVPQATREYFEALSQGPRFRWFVIEDAGRLFGMMEAGDLLVQIDAGVLDWDGVIDWLREDPPRFESLNGFVKAEEAVAVSASKRETLGRMQATGRDWLPVVDDDGRLAGVVERSRLTAALLLGVAERLDPAGTGAD